MKTLKLNIGSFTAQTTKKKSLALTDKDIEDYIWENISVSLCQIDIDNQTDAYIQYLNAVHWAKWGRDNSKYGL